MKKKERKQKIIFFGVVILLIAVFAGISYSSNRADLNTRQQILNAGIEPPAPVTEQISYSDYQKQWEGTPAGSSTITLQAVDYAQTDLREISQDGNGYVQTGGQGSISYEVDIPATGAYHIQVGYTTLTDSSASIVRSLRIDGDIPFDGADSLNFSRMWADEDKSYLMRNDENQAVPAQIQQPVLDTCYLESADKAVTGPYVFYLEAGKHTLTLESVQASLVLTQISLVPATELADYESYLAQLQSEGAAVVSASALGSEGAVYVQGEDTYFKSSSTLRPLNDRTSPLSVPYDSSNIVLNTIGGSAWSDAGMSITWQVNAPESGLYRIGMRYMQTDNRDFYSIRELKVNGEIPFAEAANLRFYYDSGFQTDYLGDEEHTDGYYFYLEEGENLLTMTVTLGDLSYAYEQTMITVNNFNTLYRRLTAVMSSSPDAYRDYNITASIPDMVQIMQEEYIRLTAVMESVGDSLDHSTKTREISKLLLQLETVIKSPDKISTELSTFNDNLTAISEWAMGLANQPIQIDYLMLAGDETPLPKAEGNFFQNLVHNVSAFVGSFTNDYKVVAADGVEKNKTIEVWMSTTSRDQYDIAQRMITNAFSEAEYDVDLRLVSADTVMPASLTGDGPDVAMQLNYTMPNNFAYRGAAVDLTEFEDFEEVAAQFADGAMEYFEYQDGYYALPDEMSYPVMYYRRDILEQLDLEIPNTWDELLALIPYLQAENMQIYFVTTGNTILGGSSSTATKPVNAVFQSLLYQNGFEIYNNGGESSNLENMDLLKVFKNWTEYYTKQNFALSMNVVTRFRTGEVPILIEDSTYINTITAAAPEIEGLWGVAQIPGTVQADGSIDRTASCMVSGAMIPRNIVESRDTKQEAWEFLKWWVSEETQLEYQQEQKALLGDAAEFPIANLAALSVSAEQGLMRVDSDTINSILSSLRGQPQVPGSYMTGREIENAFLSVVGDRVDAVDTMFARARYINSELESKRQEFGLVE